MGVVGFCRPWRFIRDTAKACMNSMFDTSNDDAAPPAAMKKMEGFGGGTWQKKAKVVETCLQRFSVWVWFSRGDVV
jgi:hypothetical protein